MTPLLAFSISVIAVILAAGCFATMFAQLFGKFDERKKLYSFMSSASWTRKYYRNKALDMGMVAIAWAYSIDSQGYTRRKSDKNLPIMLPRWYYNLFKIKYVERFPFSATLLVFLTDGFHLIQWFAIKFLALAVAINTPDPLPCFFVVWFAWSIGFNVMYIHFIKK